MNDEEWKKVAFFDSLQMVEKINKKDGLQMLKDTSREVVSSGQLDMKNRPLGYHYTDLSTPMKCNSTVHFFFYLLV